MKKYILLLVTCLLIGIESVKADTYYLPDTHTYYQRSQHTYSYMHNNELKNGYHSAVYTLINNEKQSKDTGVWDFFVYYKFPWTIDESDYFVAYCADLPVDIKTMSAYNRVALKNSTFIREDAKEYVEGILKHSYPYITEDKMIKELVDANVLVEVKTEKGTFITAPANTAPTRSVNSDELLSATQMAIYNYTNPSSIQKKYSRTEVLKGYTVTRRAGVWTNTYNESKYYEEVDNNIKAIYDYLIKQKETVYQPIEIKKVMANENNELFVNLSNNKENTNNLKFVIQQNGNKLSEYKLKKLDKDKNNNYIVPLNKKVDLSNLKISLNGTVYKTSEAYVFEALEGKEKSQTMISLLSSNMPIQTVYNGNITTFTTGNSGIINNPKTADLNVSIILSLIIISLVIGGYSIFKIYKLKK